MRNYIIIAIALTGCSNAPNHLGNPLLLPISGITSVIDNQIYGARRGQVEQFVKSNHPTLIAQIAHGGGSTLDQAFEIAGVDDRAALLLQLRGDIGLYDANPNALVTTLMVYRR